MSKEAMKLALEALDKYGFAPCDKEEDWQGFKRAITALREALAEQKSGIKQVIELYDSPDQPSQQEPVVWMYVNKSTHETKFQKNMRDFVDHSLWSEVPLYGEPLANHELQCVCGAVWLGDELVHLPDKRPPAQPQEPVQRYSPDGEGGMEVDSLGAWMKFTSPPAQAHPAREPLTDEEIDRALDAAKVPELPGGYESVELEIARAIEAAHGITKGNT